MENDIALPPAQPNAHARPYSLSSDELKGVSMFTTPKVAYVEMADIPVPPSIHSEIKGKTYLADKLGVEDSEATKAIDNFILQKMKLGKLTDGADGYTEVLKGMYKKFGLSKNMLGDAVAESLYHNLFIKGLDEEDYLVLSILAKENARKRR